MLLKGRKRGKTCFRKAVLKMARKAITKLPKQVKSNIKDSAKIALSAAKMAICRWTRTN